MEWNGFPFLSKRQIPGYPRVDRENDYLISRFDGMVLDAKPWTQLQAAALGDGAAESPPSSPTESDSVQPVLPLSELEVRHPLAQGHWANHPSKGSEPNVMVAAFDYQSSLLPGEAGLRAYIPNTVVPKAGQVTESSSKDSNLEERVPGLALVAIRPLQDEEVLLNYRLSTHVEPPPWYHPVDADEDKRRWA